jgi:hypothetical protein
MKKAPSVGFVDFHAELTVVEVDPTGWSMGANLGYAVLQISPCVAIHILREANAARRKLISIETMCRCSVSSHRDFKVRHDEVRATRNKSSQFILARF